MKAQLRAAVTMFVLLTVLMGIVYPLLITLAAQGLFPPQANGSVLERGGKLIGSELIGQYFDDPKYFWSRPSATDPAPYTSFNKEPLSGSSGSNLGPTNEKHLKAVQERIQAMRKAHPEQEGPVPVDLVTASASGLDPHISLAAAEYQVKRVAKARNVDPTTVRALVSLYTEGRQLGFLGEPGVNVLKLNLALDAQR